jgi:hypothetical protein
MTQRDNILQELRELGSLLYELSPSEVYSVPAGFFENLPGEVLQKIRDMQSIPAEFTFSREMPYAVPAGYFENLPGSILDKVTLDTDARQEIQELSPLLAGISRLMPFSVPSGYFEKEITAPRKTIKVIAITRRKIFRYAAAAVMTGVFVLAGMIYVTGNADPQKALARMEKKVTKEINRTSDKELIEFMETTAGTDVAAIDMRDDINGMLKDVPSAELQRFLDEIADPEN